MSSLYKPTKKEIKDAEKRDKEKLESLEATVKKYPLPAGVEASDLMESSKWWDRNDKRETLNDGPKNDYSADNIYEFELWHVNDWKWCIPTLFIAKARSGSGMNDRTYATRVSDGGQVRIGRGPHIQVTLKVYIRQSNVERLRKNFLKLIMDGKIGANETRDLISTRRAAGARRNRWW
jgi:hypothetical protein